MRLGSDAQRQQIGLLLRSLRLEAKLTQFELAEKLERPQSYVSKLELGHKLPEILELIEICHALKTSPIETLDRIVIIYEGKPRI